jgi:precorrin-2 methylase
VTHPNIAISESINQFFEEMLRDAIRARHVDASDAASSYLVDLMASFAHPKEESSETFAQPLAFALRDAREAVGRDRFEKLRQLGDHVLYATGFFRAHLENKGVTRSYVAGVGSTAYVEAAAMLRLSRRPDERGPIDVLSELAQKFERFADVLADVAEGTIVCSGRDERSVVRMYERWMKTGSTRLAEALGQRGIVPKRSPSGVN